ncbi:helix-turn-helix domain-containing protein [Streptomyces radiopugnans]|uniref:helix-turn-helix domain-containing protein n=1 Tax=Streptomyces radiopugnans TaxID=403935 RepID=UPI003F1D02A3
MNTGEHTAQAKSSGGRGGMGEEQEGRDAALAELRARLADGLARARLTKTQLAQRAGLGRTTVQQAFRDGAPVPSDATVAALTHVLGLSEEELLALRRTAAEKDILGAAAGLAHGPGRPIGEWDPHDLEVHPAGPAPGSGQPPGVVPQRVLPGYVRRDHDQALAEAVQDAAQGRSRMLVLVGSSSTGKTRACWEAVQPLAARGWRLWHPFDPTRAHAALEDLQRVRPRTVVWLNEAQHYLGDPRAGEEIAAAVHALLTDPGRAPVLVLGTLWPEYADQYTALPTPGRPDPHSRTRELLASRTLTVPEAFDQNALQAAATLAHSGDALLADALTRAHDHGRLAQDLAGAPELLRRYHHSTPAARAVLEAAMDARRLGIGLHLPQAFLIDAAVDYLSDHDLAELPEDWAEQAFADLAHLVHGRQASLRRAAVRPRRRPPGSPSPGAVPASGAGPVFRLADYLEQHGRTTRRAMCPPASFWHAAHTHLTHPDDLHNLARAAEVRCRLQWAHHLYLRAADAGHTDAMMKLAWTQEWGGNWVGAEALYRQAADAGDPDALRHLGMLLERAGDQGGAEALFRQAADAGVLDALRCLAILREQAGDQKGAEALYRQAADAGDTNALMDLVLVCEQVGDLEGAEAFARRAASVGDPCALANLSQMREETGDRESAEALAREAFDAGDTTALFNLGRNREEAGDRKGAEVLFHQAADVNGGLTLAHLARMREKAGDQEGAVALALKAADAGDFYVLRDLEGMRERAGDRKGVEGLCRQAADAGHFHSLGHFPLLGFPSPGQGPWPYGLDPDGTPTPPWQ